MSGVDELTGEIQEKPKKQTRTFEAGDGNKSHVGVELLLSILGVVALSRQTHSDTGSSGLDTASPQLLVEVNVDAHVLGFHHLRGKGTEHLDGMRGPLLEGPAEAVLVHVHGVLAGHGGEFLHCW